MSIPFSALTIAAGILFVFMFLYFVPVGLWITAVFSNVRISIFDLITMRLRKVPPS
ncbi:MAG TPA: flotillin-like FloA family protein, partial [Bacteroidia bacterium]|nr:flotillin-like FloA family protein [Bacteroidia bacterium]